jgi:hypothetical protein
MTDDAQPPHRRAAKVAGQALVAALAIAAFLLLPLPHIDLPAISLPDLPGWLEFLLGPGKLVILAVVVVLAALGETERRRRRETDDAE